MSASDSKRAAVLQEHLDEIAQELRKGYATMLMAELGLREMGKTVDSAPTNSVTNDTVIYISNRKPSEDSDARQVQLTVGDLRAAARTDSEALRRLQQQWIVTTFHLWEDVWRSRVSADLEVPVEKVFSPTMGDLRNFRNDILKHRGIATERNTGRNQVLRWAQPGAPITCTGKEFIQLMNSLGIGVRGESPGT